MAEMYPFCCANCGAVEILPAGEQPAGWVYYEVIDGPGTSHWLCERCSYE